MLVNHLGGKVGGREDGKVEIGWYPLLPTDAGREIFDWPDMSTTSTARASRCRPARR